MKQVNVIVLMVMMFLSAASASAYVGAEAAMGGAVPKAGEYRVGVDDVLDITVIKPETIASTVTVAPDGAITFPYIGNVKAKGMTLPGIQIEVQKRLADYMEFPVVSVILRETRSKKFVIYGEVSRPGSYPVEEDMTLLHAITVGGGFNVPGSTGRVKLLRPKDEHEKPDVIEKDITSLLSGTGSDIRVRAGDTIIIYVDKFFVSGEVVRPGAFPVEENMSLLHAITVAGGFQDSNSMGRVKLFRPKGEGTEFRFIRDLSIKAVISGSDPNVTVQPGDTIVVSGDKFFISGQVARPGAYPVEENMTLLHAVTLAGGFAESGATGTVKIFREESQGGNMKILEVSVTSLLNANAPSITVEPDDTVVVSDDRFFVYGEVIRPGMYPLDSGTTALTAISMAGGFTKFGKASRVKVLRVNQDTGTYDTIQVNIDDVISGKAQVADVAVRSGDIVAVSEGVF